MQTNALIEGDRFTTYTYDLFNRLVKLVDGSATSSYTYNAEDYRVNKTTANDYGQNEMFYFYEGDKVLLEADSQGAITAINTLVLI